MPWTSLQKTSRTEEKINRAGSLFRVNFSRVQHPWSRQVWPIKDWKDRGGPAWDWTWSPCLVYNLHVCETWGRVVLSEQSVSKGIDIQAKKVFEFVGAPPAPSTKFLPGCMVRVSGGMFTIGPDDTDATASPKGHVRIDDVFIDRYEVTIGEYVSFLNENSVHQHYHDDMADPDLCGIVRTDTEKYMAVPGKQLYPVVFVNIDAAKAFAKWAGKRLPTEFEWEAVARGRSGRLYPWGN